MRRSAYDAHRDLSIGAQPPRSVAARKPAQARRKRADRKAGLRYLGTHARAAFITSGVIVAGLQFAAHLQAALT